MRSASLIPSSASVTSGTSPADAATKPSLLRTRIDPQAAPAETDRQVSEIIAHGEGIYTVDAEILDSLAPDLILTCFLRVRSLVHFAGFKLALIRGWSRN
jgi:hypothetical protein